MVTDTTGAAVPGATVTVVAGGTGFLRKTVSNATGQYNLPGLQPAPYELSIELQGFKTAKRTGIILQVEQTARFDVALEVGTRAESIEVTAASPLIQSENASVGAVIDSQKVIDLPLNGRQFEQLATLVPGANSGAPGATNGGGFSAAGMRAEQNAFQMDGTSNSNAYQNNISIRPNIDAIQEFKIQTNGYSAEFSKGAGAQINLVTKSGTNEFHGAAYEFLRNNAVQARRLFDSNRTSFPCDKTNTDINNRAACAPPWKQNQFGFTVGGPVFFVPKGAGQRKTFFFAGYEGYRLVRGQANRDNVPTLAQRQGNFSQNLLTKTTVPDALGRTFRYGQIFDPFSSRQVTDAKGQARFVRDPFVNNIIPVSRFDPVAAKMLQNTTFVPLPNAPGQAGSDGNTNFNFLDGRSLTNDWNQGSLRIDHQITQNDMIFGRWTMLDGSTFTPNSLPGFGTVNGQRNLNGTLSWSRVITPSTLNEMRFGYMGWFQIQAAEDHLAGLNWDKTFGMIGFNHLNSQIEGSPDFTITGFTGLGNSSGPFRLRDNTFQFIDSFSFNKGRHFMKVGFDVRRVRENVTKASGTRGTFKFDNAAQTGEDGVGNTGLTLANVELGLPRQKIRRVSDFYDAFRATEYGAYFQDDFKATSRLTLNIGLRYMLYLPPADRNGHLSTIAEQASCPSFLACSKNMTVNSQYVPFFGVAEQTAAQWHAKPLPNAIAPTDKKDFGPRFGFAYRPFGQNRTVVRGGYGIFFDTVPISITQDTVNNWPYVVEDQQDLSLVQNGVPTPEGFIGFLIPSPGLRTGSGGIAGFQPGPNAFSPDFRTAYMQAWNFGIQHQLSNTLVVEVSYVGNKGNRLNRRLGINPAEPLGMRATIGDLTNDPTVRSDIGSGRNQFRRLYPFAVQDGIIVPLSNGNETESNGFSNYNGMLARVEQRYSQGLSLMATYSFSKAISDAAPMDTGGSAGEGSRVQNIFDLKSEKGLADTDHRHRFTAGFGYRLPIGKGRRFGAGMPSLLDKVIGGWGIDGISVLQSGYPITVTRAGDPTGMGTDSLRPNLLCNPNISRGQQTVARFFNTACYAAPESLVSGDAWYGTAGRGTVQGPGVINFDLSALKETAIVERFKLEVRAEFFNAFNHPNWLLTGSQRQLESSSFGQVTDTLDPRIIQFGLKLKF